MAINVIVNYCNNNYKLYDVFNTEMQREYVTSSLKRTSKTQENIKYLKYEIKCRSAKVVTYNVIEEYFKCLKLLWVYRYFLEGSKNYLP